MIQDIAPHTYDPVFRRKKPEDRDYLLHYEYNKVMLLKSGRGSVIPTFGELGAEGDFSAQAEYLFSIDDRAYYCVTDMKVPEFGGFYMEPLTVFRNFEPLHQAFAGITGSQLYRWMQSRRFCGGCGAKTEPSLKERALVCPSCGQTEYPKISPAVIVAITNGDKLLMSRYARGAYRNYALIAGFVEIGETFEDCVPSPGHFPIRRWWDLRQSWTGMTPYVLRKRSCARPAGLHGMKSWNTDLISAWDMR